MKRTPRVKIFNIFNVLFLSILGIVMVYPFLNIIAISFNDGQDATLGGITIWPRAFTTINYMVVFNSGNIPKALLFSVIMTITRTAAVLLVTSMVAYVLTKKNLLFKKAIITFFIIPMFISGGLVPYFLVIRSLGLMDNFLVYILPFLFSFYYAIVMRVYFQTNIHEALIDSAVVDGASDFHIYFEIFLPLSKPLLAAMCLFIGVEAWNDWMTTMLFNTNNQNLWTLQFILQKLVRQAEFAQQMALLTAQKTGTLVDPAKITPQTVTYATLVVATLPIIMIYPFLQKFFVSGMMLGSVKG